VIRWCCGVGVSSILAFRREALPTPRYFPNDTELALGMTLLELHWILQVFCVRQEDGGGVNRGASDIVKVESSGEDSMATGGLVSNLPHPWVNKSKQHTLHILEFKRSSDRNEDFLRVKEDEANKQHKSIIEALKVAAPEWTFEQINFVAGRRGAVVEHDYITSSKSSMYKQGKRTRFCWRMCNAYAKRITQ